MTSSLDCPSVSRRSFGVRNLVLTSFVPVFVWVLLWIRFAKGQLLRYPAQYSDSAGMVDLVGRGFNYRMRGNYLYAVYPYLFSPAQPAGSMRAFLRSQVAPEASFWRIHPYAISLPMGWLTELTGLAPRTTVALAISGSAATALALLLWLLLRYRGGPVATFGLLSLFSLYVIWPVLSQGLIGQNYFDRLFAGPAVLVCVSSWISAHEGHNKAHWCGVTGFVVCGMISERTAFVSGSVGLILLVGLFGRRLRQRNALILCFAAFANLAWGIFWQTQLQDSPYYGRISAGSVLENLKRLGTDPAKPKFVLLIAMVQPFIVLSAFDWRVLPAAFAAVGPNLVVSVGGAELSSLTTHYHQMYLPFLLSCSAFGFIRLIGGVRAEVPAGFREPAQLTAPKPSRFGLFRPLVVPLVVVVAFVGWHANLRSQKQPSAMVTAGQSLDLYRRADRQSLNVELNGRRAVARLVRDLHPTSVSAPEAFSPLLAHFGVKNYSYFPLAVGQADVVVVPFDLRDKSIVAFPFGRQPWADDTAEAVVGSLLVERYEMVQRVPVSGYDVAVYRRR